MRFGILSDIHEQIGRLRAALDRFGSERVDQVVVLGDVAHWGEDAEIVDCARLLVEAGAVGAWGNHDYPVCHGTGRNGEPAWYPDEVVEFAGRLQPRLEYGECLFTHVEPWLDTDVELNLWYIEGPPDTPAKAQRSFDATPHRIMFVGHFHRWQIATPGRILPWKGDQPICLAPDERYLILVSAVCEGQCAVFDTESRILNPLVVGS